MIIKNKHKTQEIWVTNKYNETIILKPWEQAEVEDAQGKGYLANYAHIFEKVDVSPVVNEEKEELIVSLTKQVMILTKLVERLTNGKVDELWADEKALVTKNTEEENALKEEKVKLIEELKARGLKWVWNHWSLTKLQEEEAKTQEAEPVKIEEVKI